MIEELVKGKVTSTNSDFDIVLFDLDGNSLGTKLVNTFGLAHEHDLELRSLGVVVNEFSKLSVDWVFLHWNVNSDSLLEVNDVLLKRINLDLGILQLLQELQRSLVSLVDLLFKFENVVGRIVKLSLEALLLGEEF